MFERFTDRARRALMLAQEEARMLGHNYIGTEHILLGILHEADSIAVQALDQFAVSLGQTRDEVEQLVGRGVGAIAANHLPFTPRAKKVLELALREALALGHSYIGPEHQLLGLIHEGDGYGVRALLNIGIELSEVRTQILQILSERGHINPQAAARIVPVVARQRTKADVERDIARHEVAIEVLKAELEQLDKTDS